MRGVVVMLSAVFLCACGSGDAADSSPKLRIEVGPAPAVTAPVEAVTPSVIPLSEAAEAKITEIRAVIARNSLSRFVRLAEAEPTFVSNFAGEPHRVHWDLLRRTGFDPLARLEQLLNGPYGTRQVGDKIWYIWPDLAAREAKELLPERLSFVERARLKELVGDEGLARIRRGQGYPGIRTAIAEDGRWLYFVHETEEEGPSDGE